MIRVPLPLKFAYPLCFVSGLIYWLAFPGVDIWPLSFVALVPLFVSLEGQRPKHGFWLGWMAGFGMTISGFYWLSYTLQVFSGFPLPLCWLFQGILCAYQAGRIGMFGWLATRGALRGWGRGLTLCLAFAASEQAFPLLFKWFYGATVHQVPALLQLAELGGPIAVSLVLVAANYALTELVLSRLQKRAVHKPALLGFAVPVVAAVYGLIRMPMVDSTAAASEKVEVGLVQANMSLMGKRKNKREGLERHLRLTRQLTEQKPPLDLVVWSETSVMSAVQEDEADRQLRRQFTTTLGVPALFGSVLVRPVQDAREYVLFNSALLTDKAGSIVGRFDKQILLAFGEYLPFGETFPILYEWSPHTGRFQAGTSFKPLNLGQHQIATVICYEDLLPSFVNRVMSEGEPELLANLTNDAWFGDSEEPWQHLALAKFRAVEHRKFFVRSTNSGVSAFMDPVGRVISNTKTFEEEAQRASLRWMKGKTLYTFWGDTPWWLATVASIVLAFRGRKGFVPPIAAAPAPGAAESELALRSEAAAGTPTESANQPPVAPAPHATDDVADPFPLPETTGGQDLSASGPTDTDPLPAASEPAFPAFPKPGKNPQ